MPIPQLHGKLLALLLLVCAPPAMAQQEVPLWEDAAPGLRHARAEVAEDRRETGRTDRYLSYVSKPSLTFYPAANTSGPAPVVLVLPGGGFHYVAIDKEGHEVARWLSEHGVAAAVLKYRTVEPDAQRSWSVYTPLIAQGDAARAMRVLRHRAEQWQIAPNRIAMLGFSAGGAMAIAHTIDADTGNPAATDPIDRLSSMPASIGLVYTALPDMKQPRILPKVPFFIVHGADDKKIPAAIASKLFGAITGKGGAAELHLFQNADHGFGITPPTGTVRAWPALYVDWLRNNQER